MFTVSVSKYSALKATLIFTGVIAAGMYFVVSGLLVEVSFEHGNLLAENNLKPNNLVNSIKIIAGGIGLIYGIVKFFENVRCIVQTPKPYFTFSDDGFWWNGIKSGDAVKWNQIERIEVFNMDTEKEAILLVNFINAQRFRSPFESKRSIEIHLSAFSHSGSEIHAALQKYVN